MAAFMGVGATTAAGKPFYTNGDKINEDIKSLKHMPR